MVSSPSSQLSSSGYSSCRGDIQSPGHLLPGSCAETSVLGVASQFSRKEPSNCQPVWASRSDSGRTGRPPVAGVPLCSPRRLAGIHCLAWRFRTRTNRLQQPGLTGSFTAIFIIHTLILLLRVRYQIPRQYIQSVAFVCYALQFCSQFGQMLLRISYIFIFFI